MGGNFCQILELGGGATIKGRRVVEEETIRIREQYELDLRTLNVIYYTSAVSILEKDGKLREQKTNKQPNGKPGWQIRHETWIEAIRRKLSYTTVLEQSRRQNKYTKHQKVIKKKMEKWYGKMTAGKIGETQSRLKQELRVE